MRWYRNRNLHFRCIVIHDFVFVFGGISLHYAFLFRNVPHIHVHEKRENKERWHGAEIQIVIEGNWTTYRVCSSKIVIVQMFSFMHWKQLNQIINLLCFRKLIFSFCFYSPKYCIICGKWLSSRPMLNSFSDSYQIFPSTLSPPFLNYFVYTRLQSHTLIEVDLLCLYKATYIYTMFEFIKHVLISSVTL